MNRCILAVVASFAVLHSGYAQTVSGHEPRILYVNSYHPGNAWSDMIFLGIRETLTKQYGKQYDLRVEYLDAKRYGASLTGKLGEQIALSWQEKYKNVPIDIILVSDQDGYKFVNRIRNKLFPNVPLIFSGVEDPGTIAPNTTGVLTSTDFAENLALIHQTLPSLKELWVVTDPSTTGTINRRRFDDAARAYSGKIQIRYFDDNKRGIMPDPLLQKAYSLTEGTAIFFLDYYRTPNNDAVDTPEFLKKLCNAKVPVFSHVDAYIDYGVTGGYMNSGELQGRQIAQMAVKIIGGTDISALKPEKEHALAIFDDEKLIKFGIIAKNLPKNSFFKSKDQINSVKYSRVSPGMGGNTIYARGDHNYPPFEFINAEGKPDGFNVEIIRAVAKAMSMEVQIELGVWNDVRQQLEAGDIDLLIGMYNTPERDKKVDFSIPMFMASYAVYVRNDSDITGMDDLKNKTVLLQKGDVAYDYFIGNNITRNIISNKDWTDVLVSLSKGEGDAAVVSRIQGNEFIINEKLGNIKTVGPPIIQRKYCIAVTEGNSLLLAKINEGLSLIKTSGEYDRIYEKWFGVVNPEADAALITKKILLWVALPLVILLLIFLAFSWILKQQVNRKTRELKESEQRFRLLFEAMPFPVVVSRLSDGKHLFVNDAYTTMVGRSRNEIIGKSAIEMGVDPETSNRQRAELLENGRLDGVIIEMPKTDSTLQWFQYSAIMAEIDGEQVAISGLVDITALKEAEKTSIESKAELLRQNSILNTLLDNLNSGVFMVEAPTGRPLIANQAAKQLLGRDILPDAARENLNEVYKAYKIGTKTPYPIDEMPIIRGMYGEAARIDDMIVERPDGTQTWLEIHGSPLRNEQGEVWASLVSFEDITERKQAEKALAESEARLREIGNNLPGGMIYQVVQPKDGVRRFSYVSEGSKDMHGFEPKEFLENFFLFFQQIHPDDVERIIAAENYTVQHLSNFDEEVRIVLPSGEVRWRRFISSPRRMSNGDLAADGIEMDITDRKNAEQALINYKNNLEMLVKERTEELEATNEELSAINEELFYKNDTIVQKNEELELTLENLKQTQIKLIEAEKMASLGVLTAGVAHEINNPLNYIMGAFVALERIHAEKSYEANAATINVLLKSLETGVNRASNIVKGLNQFSRSNKSLDEDCSLHLIIDNCLTMLQNKLKHRISIDKQFSTSDLIIKGNVGNLHQVFLNIIGNSIDAIPAEGTITIETFVENKQINVFIKDTGEGISQEIINKITDPFFTTKAPGKGTGLGLSISYNIIKEHQGTIEFASEKGKGTDVKLAFPIY